MRILFLGNNWVGWQVLKWLKFQNEDIAGLVMHPPNRRRYGKNLLSEYSGPQDAVWDATALRSAETIEAIQVLKPDIGVSAYFGYILREPILKLFPMGCINIHPAFLPYNRGANPNVWSIIDETPAGVTIHYMDVGVDTGDLISQQRVEIELTDTGESLYRKLEQTSVALFKKTWPAIHSGTIKRTKQPEGDGSNYFLKDTEKIDKIDLDRQYKARDLINILRARTFPPYHGAYFLENDEKVFMRLQLYRENHSKNDDKNE